MDIFYGWVRVGGGGFWYILGERGWVDIFYGWMGVGEGIFWVGGGEWTFFMDGWWWVEVYFASLGCVEVSGMVGNCHSF